MCHGRSWTPMDLAAQRLVSRFIARTLGIPGLYAKLNCRLLSTNHIVTLISFAWCVDVILHSVLFCHVARASI